MEGKGMRKSFVPRLRITELAAWLIIFSLLFFHLGACGGGGSDSDPVPTPNSNNELLQGNYVEAAIWNGGCGIYDVAYSGDGEGSYETLYHSDTDDNSDVFAYDVNDDGTLTASREDGEIWHGIVSEDGSIVVYVADHGSMAVEVRKSDNANNSILIGKYVDAAVWGGVGLYYLDYDGIDTGFYETIFSSDNSDKSETFDYTIKTNGTLEAQENSGRLWQGIVDNDGNPIVYVGDGGEIEVSVKKSSAADNSLLFGEYTEAAAWLGGCGIYVVEYDGNGNGTYQALYHSDGNNNSGSFTYNIGSDGTLTGSEPGKSDWHGIVSHDGELVVYVNDDPAIEVGVRKHSTIPIDPTPNQKVYCDGKITIDGANADWDSIGSVMSDVIGDGGSYSGLDVSKLFITNDEDYACLRVDRTGTIVPNGEAYNYWIYFKEATPGGKSFAIEAYHESKNRVYARLWDTTNASNYNEFDKLIEGIPYNTATTSMEFAWPLQQLSKTSTYKLEFRTHHTINGNWEGDGDDETRSVDVTFDN